MKILLKAYYTYRLSCIRARQHDLSCAWQHTKARETNPLSMIEYRHAVNVAQVKLATKATYFASKLAALKTKHTKQTGCVHHAK